MLTASVHLAGATLTLVGVGGMLALATAGPTGFTFEPGEVCADVLGLPEKQVLATSVDGREACAVTSDNVILGTVPLQPAWWPWAVVTCAVLFLAALVPVVVAALLRHSSRPQRARQAWALLGLSLTLACVASSATGWAASSAKEVDPDALAAARALAPALTPPSPTTTATPVARPTSRQGLPGEAPACTAAELRVSRTRDVAALGGKVGSTLEAENTSEASCLLAGPAFPVVGDPGGTPAGLYVERLDAQHEVLLDDAVLADPVLLVPGSRATTLLEWSWSQSPSPAQAPAALLRLRLSADGEEIDVNEESEAPANDGQGLLPFTPPDGSTVRIGVWIPS